MKNQKQEITARMAVRIDAFIALKNALLPAFCEDMACDETCPMYRASSKLEPCSWQRTYEAIDRMAMQKARSKIAEDEPEIPALSSDPDFLEID